jgi:toxin ParE1/3/4
MEVRWSPEAADDLERIVRRIHDDNPQAARELASTLYDGCASLTSFPNRGRTGRLAGTRELLFPAYPSYIAVYRVTVEAVEIARIWHVAQERPSPF